jgi:hypothetical protein
LQALKNDEEKMEAAGVEIYRDANETERLLHDQELGVPGDPTASAVIWWHRAERGQSNRARVRTRRRAAQLCPDRQSGGFLGTMRCTVERGRLAPMTAAVKAVLKQAMQLSPEERAEVANALDGMSADAPALSPDDLAVAWRPELDRRREELERGEVQTVDAREAIAGIRARLRSGE